MKERTWSILSKVGAIASAVLVVTSLSAIAVQRAEDRDPELVAAGDAGDFSRRGGGSSAARGGLGDVDEGSAGGAGSEAGGATGGDVSGSGTSASSGGGGRATNTAAGGGGGGRTAPPGGGQQASTGCPDYNPNEGVYCDRYLVGGTTVLSGPLAIYGEQGLKGAIAFINWFNSEFAAQNGARKIELVWYDDNLDPNKTLQFTQRLYEVDKVLLLGGVTSPEAIVKYLEEKQFPMIGDIGLSPKSYASSMIFPTAPPYETRSEIRTKIAKDDFQPATMAVIQDILPGVDSTPIRNGWFHAAEKFGVELVDYREIESTSSDCSSQFLSAVQKRPEYLMLPIAATPMLACLRTANTQGVKPGATTSPYLKGWSGGSNLQIEVDQCLPICDGMYSGGTIFRDPRTTDTPEIQQYKRNMAKYAPGIDITGFITINYYHAGWLQFHVMKSGGILKNLSRRTLVEAANKFGPFDTGFGNTVEWRPTVPRVPTSCGYRVVVDGRQEKWVFGDEKVCA